jgi:hypothetical protein
VTRKVPLDYAAAPAKARLRRYGILAFGGSLGGGLVLACAWIWVLTIATAHRSGWAAHLGKFGFELILWGLLCTPVLLATLLFDRTKRRLLATEIAAEKAEEKRLRDEENRGIGWKVPKSAEAGDWPIVVILTVVMYIITFVAILIIGTAVIFIDHLIPSRRHLDDGMSALRGAFFCANFFAVMILGIFVLMLLLFPRVRVTLVSDGVFKRVGSLKSLIPYSSIKKVYIVPSRRRASLKCFAILAADDRHGEQWHRFDFGADAPVPNIIKAFELKGLSVKVGDQSETLGDVLN